MARNKTDSVQDVVPPSIANAQGESIVFGSPIRSLDDVPKGDIYERAGSTKPAFDPDRLGPPPQKWLVMKGGILMEGGFRIEVKAGKILDERNYDIKALKRVGIKMDLVTEED